MNVTCPDAPPERYGFLWRKTRPGRHRFTQRTTYRNVVGVITQITETCCYCDGSRLLPIPKNTGKTITGSQ